MNELYTFNTNDPVLLKEAYRERSKKYSDDRNLENEFWCFLYEIGYSKLNNERECRISFNGTERKIDIVAENNESKLFIECTIENSLSKVDSTIGKFNSYSKFTYDKNRNTALIFYTDQNYSDVNIAKLKDAGITFIRKSTLAYFRQLLKGNKQLALYQFYAFIFSGQLIKSYQKQYLEIPALKAKDLKGHYYIFSVHPQDILPLSTVPHRENHSHNQGVSKSYQRLVDNRKINSIKEYINKDKSFPTNLIVNINKSKNLKGFEKKGENLGILKIEPRFGTFSIIDGQHRLLSYCNEEKATTHYLTVTAYVDLDIKEQIETFVTINEEQKPVSKNLLWDLYPELYDENNLDHGYKVKLSKFVKTLNEKENSPLHHCIQYPSAPRGSKSAPINLNNFCVNLNNSKLIANKNSKLSSGILTALLVDDWEVSIKDLEKVTVELFWQFFETSKNLAGELWRKNKFYVTDLYLGSHILLFKSIFKHLTKINSTSDSDINNLDFKTFLLPVSQFINQLDQEEIKDFKKSNLGGGGAKSAWESFIKLINDIHPEFEGKYLQSIRENHEIDTLLDELNRKGETDSLEAKETFFYDANRIKKTGEFHFNDNMTRDIVKTVVSFANGRGGHILLGLGDPKSYDSWEVLGLNDTDLYKKSKYFEKSTLKEKYTKAVFQKIISICDNNSDLKEKIEVRIHPIDGLELGVIKVSMIDKVNLEQKNLFTIDNKAYKRTNDEKLELKLNDITSYCERMIHELYPEEKSIAIELDQEVREKLATYLPKRCPKCDKEVKTYDRLMSEFGIRVSNEKTIPQSYCRLCRKK